MSYPLGSWPSIREKLVIVALMIIFFVVLHVVTR